MASTYLVESNLTVGWSLPRPARPMTVLMPAETRPREHRPSRTASSGRPIALADPGGAARSWPTTIPSRSVLPNGLRLI